MSVVACPKCAEKVTLPPKTPPAAKVRCPLCAEDYLLEEAMSTLPPMLEVLELPEGYQPAEEVDISTAAFLATADRPAVLDDGAELKLQDPGGVAVADEEPRYDEWGPTRSTSSAQADAVITPRELLQTPVRKKKKQINPLVHIVGIVLGGVLAIPAALMILLWLPGSLRRDIMEIGPWLGQNAPYLAPADFRTSKSDASQEETDKSTKQSDTTPAVANKKKSVSNEPATTVSGDPFGSPGKRDSTGEEFEDTFQASPFSLDGDDRKPKSKPKAAPKFEDLTEPEPAVGDKEFDFTPDFELDLNPETKPDPRPEPDPLDESAPRPVDEPLPDPVPEVKPDEEKSDEEKSDSGDSEPQVHFELPEPSRPAPVVDPLQPQREALAAADQSFDEAATPADKKAAAVTLYRVAAELAERLPSDVQGTGGLDHLLEDKKKVQFFGVYAASWQGNQERATPGIVLSGTVKECRPAGERFEVTVELPSRDKPELMIITAKECQAGQQVFAAGRFVMNAKDMVSGYEGNATMAIDARVLKVLE